jgi:hypothetical protein
MKGYNPQLIEYYAMNSWNCAKNPAIKMKLYTLPIPKKLDDNCYELIQSESFHDRLNWAISDFEEDNADYTAGFNGRSGGYLVLYPKKGTIIDQAENPVSEEVLENFKELARCMFAELIYCAKNMRKETIEIVTKKEVIVID